MHPPRLVALATLVAALQLAAPAAADVQIRITPGGYEPDDVTVTTGEAVHFTNDSDTTQSVVGATLAPRFDSGPIPPGGGYSLAVPRPGVYDYSSSAGTLHEGTLRVVLDELDGPADAPVADHIPDSSFPAAEQDDLGIHPVYPVRASRTRIMLAFRDGATVAQANDALAAADVVLLGGLPRLGVLLVAAPSTPDFSGLLDALATLRAHPAVETAAMSTEVGHTALPPTSEIGLRGSPFNWTWNVVFGGTEGDGGNWGLEASRFPQAWNLRGAIAPGGADIETAMIDAFDPHPDLPDLTIRTGSLALCRDAVCTSNTPHWHGTAVAGVIGAKFDAGAVNAISGANPVARMHGVPWDTLTDDRLPATPAIHMMDGVAETIELMLEHRATAFPGLRVINLSLKDAIFHDASTGRLFADQSGQPLWWKHFPWPSVSCGPGEDDDQTATEREPCTPGNLDGWLREFAELGEISRTTAELAAREEITIVQAAGNDSDVFCLPDSCRPIDARGATSFAWAAGHWDDPALTNPILVAEATNVAGEKALFSNVFPREGGISAPGHELALADAGGGYKVYSGTSFAAPHVSGLVGYLLALDPDLTLEQIRRAVLANARPGVVGGQPRLDAFASVLSLSGMAHKLVNVNGPTRDGNLRVRLGAGGSTSLLPSARFSPDPSIDMRDFRRFRDAWLFACESSLTTIPGCPGFLDIGLDGPIKHPAKDLNLDGCVNPGRIPVIGPPGGPDCPEGAADEDTYPRFDFNGDGRISHLSNGANVPPDGNAETDLTMLEREWTANPDPLEGWHKEDLFDLMESADLQVHARDFYEALDDFPGAPKEIDIEVVPVNPNPLTPPVRRLKLVGPESQAVITIPAVNVEVRARATVGADVLEATPVAVGGLSIGEDRRVDLCVARVDLAASSPNLPADGESQVLVTGRVRTCAGAATGVAGKPVELSIDPSGGDHATVAPANVTTGTDGEFETRVTAGTEEGEYTVTARVELAEGRTLVGKLKLRATPKLTIRYLWKQDTLDWEEEGTTRWLHWPAPPPPGCSGCDWEPDGLMPPPAWWTHGDDAWQGLLEGADTSTVDCTYADPGIDYCMRHGRIGPDPDKEDEGLSRAGTLTGWGARFELDETVGANRNHSLSSIEWDPETNRRDEFDSFDVVLGSTLNVRDDQRERYTDHQLEDVFSTDTADAVRLHGLREVAELRYINEIDWHVVSTEYSGSGGPDDPPGLPSRWRKVHRPLEWSPFRGELALDGHPDDFRFAEDLSKPLQFVRRADGTLEPYASCLTLVKQVREPAGWYATLEGGELDPWLPGWAEPRRTREYIHQAANPWRIMPARYGELRRRISFAAVAAYGDDVPDVELPDCDGPPTPRPPAADFQFGTGDQRSIAEGRRVQFSDRSIDPDDDIAEWSWEFGDGDTSTEQHPAHFYDDDGTFTVRLTVTDAEGETDTETKLVHVSNLPPEPQIEDASALEGQPLQVPINLWDPGADDRTALDWELTSPLEEFPTQSGTLGSGPHTLAVAGVAPGVYPVELTVTDKDGASAVAEAVLEVTDEPGDEPEPPLPVPTCDPDVALDPEEQHFFELLNDYRRRNGVQPLREISPDLTRASRRHNEDMEANNFFAHVSPTDGTTPQQRAAREGYPGLVGENLALLTQPTALNALQGWISSPGHNANMLDPDWRTVGIDREPGSFGGVIGAAWTTVYGDVTDCPAAARMALAAAAAEPAPFPAFVVSTAEPLAGEPVELTNRSRAADGTPVGGRLEPGAGHGAVDLGADAGVQRTYDAAGAVTAQFTADGGGEVARTLVVRHRPTAVEYSGPVRGAAGGRVHVIARLTEGTQPLAGREISFTIGEATAGATTGADGVAETTLSPAATLAPGDYELVVAFAGDTRHAAIERRVPFEIATGTPPVADAGGPYELPQGHELTLDGSASSGDAIAEYDWDLDGDGGFDDATGAVVQVPHAQVVSLLCGGTCEPDRAYTVALRVTDGLGLTGTATATVTVRRDFGLSVSPSSQPIAPGGRTGFKVDVTDLGYDGPVTLSVEGLPAGFTAQFDAPTVTPTATTVVQITAPSSAPQADVPFTVVATGGGLRREAGGEASVTFGLIPVCFGSYTGTVVDRETREPIAGLRVGGWDGGITAADGSYTVTGVPLGINNAPQSWQVGAGGGNTPYWQEFRFVRALCGASIRVDFELVRRRTGALAGRVVEAGTETPLPGALVVVGSTGLAPATDADGRYSLPAVPLLPGNAPATHQVRAELDGFWPQTKPTTVTAGTTTEQSFELVRICHATLRGGRIVNRQGQPVPGRRWVSLEGHTPVESDEDGRFEFDLEIRLGTDNAPRTSFLQVGTTTTSFDITECGQIIDVDAVVDIVTPNYGFIEGVVRDEESGEPVAGAFIQPGGVLTDANGRYRTQVFVGNDDDRTELVGVRASGAGHFDSALAAVQVTADETAQQDLVMLLIRYGSVEGTVRDAETGAPIAEARIRRAGFEIDRTGDDGRYSKDHESLGLRNAPRAETYRVDAAGYWFGQQTTTLRADQSSIVDFALVRRCEGARITGRVLNALTRAPINNALVEAQSGDEVRRTARTGPDGQFEIAGVAAGHNNTPTAASVTASAPGFITQTKSVTVFCGASIDVDFGPADTVFGTIVGTVTDAAGAPVAGAFVGSEFGRSATTGAAGGYRLENVPLGVDGADREWDVTVIAAGFPTAVKPVVARAGTEVRADFVLGAPVNQPPVAEPGSVTVDEDGEVEVTLDANDPDDDDLTFTVVRGPRHGTLTGLRYEPDPDFNGSDDFEFRVSDGEASSEATVSLTVRPVDDPPRPADDSLSTSEDASLAFTAAQLLANDAEVDGEALTISDVAPPAQAPFTLTRAGDAFTLTPRPGFFGSTAFTYTATDGHTSATATVAVEVVEVPRAPVCADVTFSGDGPISGTLTCTDRDPLTYAVVAQPAHGTVSLAPGGAFTYTPAAGFHGSDSFTFRASDGALESAPATVRLEIAAPPAGGDLAFWGNVALVGNPEGFKVYDITNPDKPRLKATTECAGPEGDLSVYNKLVFVVCGGGIRIFDLKDPRNPVAVKTVSCGSSRHTLVPDLKKNRVLLYGSTCIVAVPLWKPATASVIKSDLPGCHDVAVFIELNRAAAACGEEAQIWDISDPADPKLDHRIDHPGLVWRTASFTWDGRYVAFGLEACAVKVYSLKYRKLVGRLSIPREPCRPSNFNFITTEHHRKLVGGWLAGGTSVASLTDPTRPTELVSYAGKAAASYWYNDRVYSNDADLGLRVFKYAYPSAERLAFLNPQTQISVID